MNHFTSYTVSKQLAEAGIQWDACVFVSEDNNYFVEEYFSGCYPAYTAGELLRELPVGTQLYKDRVAYLVGEEDAPTPEDALGLALLAIRKEKVC